MTSLRPPDPSQPSASQTAQSVEKQLETAHWHISRGDQLRAGVATRAGTVLSTNALVIAGVALAFSLRGQRPGVALVVTAMTALGCVALSVGNATLALITFRNWERQFDDQVTPTALLYCHAEMSRAFGTFEEFKRTVTSVTPEERLEFAHIEWWRCVRLHGYRYKKLRIATCWLLAALILFVVATAAAALR